jgi:superfamily II DNA or RNA helicase
MKTLRVDQTEAIDALRVKLMTTKRVVLQAPTGAGKTVIISDIVSKAHEKGRKVLITVPAILLVDQTVVALAEQGVTDVGVIQADHPMTDWSKPVQIASVQTLMKRWADGQMPAADIVLVDETHRRFDLFNHWMASPLWQERRFIGFSATPWSKGLGLLYPGGLVQTVGMRDLIEQGVLVPFRTFAPDMPDLSKVRTFEGEFIAADLEEVMRPKTLVANIVETWKELGEGRPTVAFCCTINHAKQVAEEFVKAGIGAAQMDCDTPALERRAIRDRMLRGEVRVVCNVEVVGIGVDWPEVSCIIYARPTRSDMRFVQNVGRGLRAAPGKKDLLILDHSTTTARLGFVDEVYGYHGELHDGKTKPKRQVVALPKVCPGCFLLKPPRVAVCPHCGHRVEQHAEPVKCERGTLREVGPDVEAKDWRKQLPDKEHVYGQLWWYAQHKGYKPGYAAVKTKEIFGSFPRAREPDPETIEEPVPELYAYLADSVDKWKKEQYKLKRRQRIATAQADLSRRQARAAQEEFDNDGYQEAAE